MRSETVECMSITCAASSATVCSRPCAASGLSLSGGHSRETVRRMPCVADPAPGLRQAGRAAAGMDRIRAGRLPHRRSWPVSLGVLVRGEGRGVAMSARHGLKRATAARAAASKWLRPRILPNGWARDTRSSAVSWTSMAAALHSPRRQRLPNCLFSLSVSAVVTDCVFRRSHDLTDYWQPVE